MSLLNRILKPKQSEESVEDRIASLQSANQEELLTLACTSPEVKLREEAVRKLAYGQELLSLAKGDHPARVILVARQKIGAYLEKDTRLIDTLLGDEPKDSESLPDVISLISYSPAAIEKVLSGVNDEKILVDIASQGTTSSVRQYAATKTVSREHLETLLEASKDKDKSVFKIVKSKLDVFKEAQARLAEKQAQAKEISAGVEKLAKRKLDEHFPRRLQQLQTEWDKLSQEERCEASDRYQAAVDACLLILNKERALAEEQQKLAAEREQSMRDLLDISQALRSSALELYSAELIDSEQRDREFAEYSAQVDAIKEKGFVFPAEYKAYARLAESARQLLLELKEGGPLSALVCELKSANQENGHDIRSRINQLLRHTKALGGEAPAIVQEASAAIADWVQAKNQKIENEKKTLKKINELIRKANWAVDNGRVRQARGIVRELHEKREKHPALPQNTLTRLDELDETIKKLGDWHQFAVLPKKEALVEKMEALVGSSLHPDDLADRIKNMQEEWKILCKGGENQDQELWERMHAAAEKAFEPCKEFFEEKAGEREQNLAKREQLIAQMATYFDAYSWDKPIWKDVEQTLTLARETWKSYWPVPRKEINALQEKFDAVLDKIHAKLREANEAKKEAKSQLVSLAEALVQQEDTANATNQAKQLQAQWQALGGMGGHARKEEQKLWKKFRAACDAIFEKREQEYEAVNAERNQELEKAKAVLSKLDGILKLKAQAFIEGKKGLKALKDEFYAIGEMPKNEQRKLKDAFQKKCELIENIEQKERNAAIKKSWHAVYEIADLVRAYETAVLSGSDGSDIEDTLAAVNEALNDIPSWPSGTKALIQQRIKNAPTLNVSAAESEKALRLLCIRKEISRGEESPLEDKGLRMAYQVEQLQQGFRGQNGASADSAETLALAWLAVAGAPEEVYSELFKRFI